MEEKVGKYFQYNYAPQVDRSEAEREGFWGMLDDVTTVTESEVLLVAGNLNGHIGEDRRGFEEVMGAHGFGVRNQVSSSSSSSSVILY